MAKTALVLGGGGARSAFAVGVIKYLQRHHPDINFDIICGTSSGALLAFLTTIGEIALAEKIFTTNATEDILSTGNTLQRLTNNNISLYNIIPLLHKINGIITDQRFDQLMSSDRELLIATKSLQTGQSIYFSNKAHTGKGTAVVKLNDVLILREVMIATFTQPVFMPPVDVETDNKPATSHQLIDGGGPLYMPVKAAIEAGATDIYVILLTPEKPEELNIQFKNLIDVLERTMDWSTMDLALNDIAVPRLYNQSLQYLEAVKNKMKKAGVPADTIAQYFDVPEAAPFAGKKIINIHVIRPDMPTGVTMGGLEFNPRNMKIMIGEGERKAAQAMKK